MDSSLHSIDNLDSKFNDYLAKKNSKSLKPVIRNEDTDPYNNKRNYTFQETYEVNDRPMIVVSEKFREEI